ncbi:putative Polygalacturonase 2 [Hibiscus syriacus]|uniref:Polygalacturonase 2 n=1 Tax=Hibiscus syriacus TaxID=106335 RepID=A0A6A2XKV6_HIBSY|nr:transcription factor bHLH162-like [Hibiscus syriacus]KAE8676168.1 putative Polygalacturonase 2 [Hibiscus syriacus]
MKMNSGGGQSSKPDRKTIERRRRNDMKTLCFKLTSLIPHHIFKPSKETVSQQDQLHLAATYIARLRERVEKLKKTKEEAMKSVEPNGSIMEAAAAPVGLSSPVVELRDLGSSIELVLITGLNRNFMLYQVISILEQEGAEVVSASFSTLGGKIFHSIHAQAKLSRVGVETTRASQRLQELIRYH